MPSTYTNNLGIQKPANGEQSGSWGDTVNTNSDILDVGINGVLSLTLSGTSSTLTTSDGTLSNGQYKALVLIGTPSGTHTITISPNDAQKIYYVYNTTSQTVVFTQGSGGNVTLLASDSTIIYANGAGSTAAVVSIADHLAMSSARITGGSITGITDLAIADGGTGASDAANARFNLGLGTMSQQASISVSISGGTITGITDLAIADGGTGASTAANARTNLGLAIGTNVQAYNAALQSISGLTVVTDRILYTTATNTYAATALTSFGRTLLDDGDAATARSTLGAQASLGFTPVEQGGGPSQSTNKVNIGWNAIGMFMSVDGTSLGRIITNADATGASGTQLSTQMFSPGNAPLYGCRAWVNFDGSGTIGANQTIRASGNVTSVLKTASGSYTVTFTTAMIDAGYALSGSCTGNFGGSSVAVLSAGTTTVQISTTYYNTTIDPDWVNVIIFR
jgi:hypothetical protein